MKREKAYKIIEAIKQVREAIPDELALENIDLYPDWKKGIELKANSRVVFNEKLYKVLQTHISQEDWVPSAALTLFEPLDIINEGTLENPIVAATGMTYYKGKYYLDETTNTVYLCNRDDSGNGTTLYHMPSQLLGVYFDQIK